MPRKIAPPVSFLDSLIAFCIGQPLGEVSAALKIATAISEQRQKLVMGSTLGALPPINQTPRRTRGPARPKSVELVGGPGPAISAPAAALTADLAAARQRANEAIGVGGVGSNAPVRRGPRKPRPPVVTMAAGAVAPTDPPAAADHDGVVE